MANNKIGRPGLFARLKQHHIFRIASWYATAAYVLILVANAVFPDVGLTREDVRYVIATVALCFPVVLTLSWIFVPPSDDNPEEFGRWKRLRRKLGPAVSLIVIAFVSISGIYLWRLDVRHQQSLPQLAGVQSITVLPFEHVGQVPDEFVPTIKASIERELSGLGTVTLVTAPSGATIMTPEALAKMTGATLLVRGTLQRGEASDFTVHYEVLTTKDGIPLYDATRYYDSSVHPADLGQELATVITGGVRFALGFQDVLAKDYPVSRDAEAVNLLRRALISRRYSGTRPSSDLCREALKRDSNFAQAHAYLALSEAWSFGDETKDHQGMQDEIAAAEKLAPGLPEARMARAAYQFFIDSDSDAALATLATIHEEPMNNTDFYGLRSYILKSAGKIPESLQDSLRAMRVDPYLRRPVLDTALMYYVLKDYGHSIDVLDNLVERWPTFGNARMWRVQVEFAYHGDVSALAKAVNADLRPYGWPEDSLLMKSTRIELAHLQGRHADAVALLKAYPEDCLELNGWGSITQRATLCADSYMVESQRLLGDYKGAKEVAELRLPEVERDARANPEDGSKSLHLALLQVFGARYEQALRTIAPFQTELVKPVEKWTEWNAESSIEVAVVLAWSGKKKEAIDLLAKSLEAPFGAHPAILAHDPTWRPLYSEPAFAALLAAHGQKLAYVK